MRHVLVYGDVNLNLIDGSAIWAQSTVLAFANLPDTRVSLLLRAPVETDRLIAPLTRRDNINIVGPFEQQLLPGLSRSLSPHQVAILIDSINQTDPIDVIVVRGMRVANHLSGVDSLPAPLWTYLTDIPQTAVELSEESLSGVRDVVAASSVLLCQTEDLRSHIEMIAPAAVGKTWVTPPVVDAPHGVKSVPPAPGEHLRIVYSGKMARLWMTEEMTRLPEALDAMGISAELHVIGDKIHNEPSDPEFADRMRKALEAPGVVWHGGVEREEAIRIAASCHVGIGWRDCSMDTSLELSTKLLEYGAIRLPVVLNRNPAHVALLGEDYSAFANDEEQVLDVLRNLAVDEGTYCDSSQRCHEAADFFMIERASERLEKIFLRTESRNSGLRFRLKLVVASHDFKFIDRLIDEWRRFPDIEIRIDRWTSLSEHDGQQSQELLDWADVVVCEWCGPNAIWYSQRVQQHQRLIVRLHRFELYANYPKSVQIENVDAVVAVDEHYAELIVSRLGWPRAKVITIPNWVDIEMLRRSKIEGARFNLGMIGIAPRRKRLDLALDVVAKLREKDDRFGLFIKTKMPWDYWWIWNDPEERSHYRHALRRIQTDPALQGSVTFDGFGPDVGAWLRKVGCVLSTSDDESFHLSPAEGMASGATAVVFPWPGAESVYESDWRVQDVDGAVELIAAQADENVWLAYSDLAQRQIQSYDLPVVTDRWVALLTEGKA